MYKEDMKLRALSEPFKGQCPHHKETSLLICSANQLTSFYMMGTLVVKGLNHEVLHL